MLLNPYALAAGGVPGSALGATGVVNVSGVGGAATGDAASGTVFLDTFTGSAGEIDGHPPDTAPSGFVWSGSAGTLELDGAGSLRQVDIAVSGSASSGITPVVAVGAGGYRLTAKVRIAASGVEGAFAQIEVFSGATGSISLTFSTTLNTIMNAGVQGTDQDDNDFAQTGSTFSPDSSTHVLVLTVLSTGWSMTFDGSAYLSGADIVFGDVSSLGALMAGGVVGPGNATLKVDELKLETL